LPNTLLIRDVPSGLSPYAPADVWKLDLESILKMFLSEALGKKIFKIAK
jgi:hypothetical protein